MLENGNIVSREYPLNQEVLLSSGLFDMMQREDVIISQSPIIASPQMVRELSLSTSVVDTAQGILLGWSASYLSAEAADFHSWRDTIMVTPPRMAEIASALTPLFVANIQYERQHMDYYRRDWWNREPYAGSVHYHTHIQFRGDWNAPGYASGASTNFHGPYWHHRLIEILTTLNIEVEME
jgi:hypothetical protein